MERYTKGVESLPIACRLVLAGGVRVSASIQPAGQRTNRSVAASGSPGMGACHFHGMRTWGAWEVARGPFPHVSEPRDPSGLSPSRSRLSCPDRPCRSRAYYQSTRHLPCSPLPAPVNSAGLGAAPGAHACMLPNPAKRGGRPW